MSHQQFWLAAQEMQLVKDLAEQTGRPIASIVRSAMQRYVAEELVRIHWHKESAGVERPR